MLAPISSSPNTPVLPTYQQVLVAADASDHSNYGVSEAIAVANLWQATITGAHVYAAKLHDARFRQMEGGLPPQYQEEAELEKQRNIHDDLITKGLSVITDSYLDQAEESCQDNNLNYVRRSLEGKNYKQMVDEANAGKYDLLVLGAQGLGAVPGGRLGTVCQRVCRRTQIDTLVIKDLQKPISQGPIVVAVDGSSKSYGGLLSALSLAKQWQLCVHVVSAYDPYYHYVAFNRIANVLSDEAGKVFRFKEQEQLHEDIIDAGLAKIYQGHLDVCESLAAELNTTISTQLLDGKPHEVISKVVKEMQPSLLVMGKLGIHADDDLDIGGNAENLLHDVDCSVLLSNREYTPATEILAETTTTWSNQANARMQRIPSFAQGMARTAILRYAQQQGHTVITASIVDEATAGLCPAHVGQSQQDNAKAGDMAPTWSQSAQTLLDSITDSNVKENCQRRAEKKARQDHSASVELVHVQAFVEAPAETPTDTSSTIPWDSAALALLERVPDGSIRDMASNAVQTIALKNQATQITSALVKDTLNTFQQGSEQVDETLAWSDDARAGIAKAPPMVRGMLTQEIEAYATQQGQQKVTAATVQAVKQRWQDSGYFHQGDNDARSAAMAAPKLETPSLKAVYWPADAAARLAKVPAGFMREACKQRVEKAAIEAARDIDLNFVEQCLQQAKQESMGSSARAKCPLGHSDNSLQQG